MQFKIIEDCSPYYIRYVHTDYEKIINWSREYKRRYIDNVAKKKFMHVKLPENIGTMFLKNVYKADDLKLIPWRVSLFVTQPGYYYRPHRDGLSIKVGINYSIEINDDMCQTGWYNNEDFADRPIDTLGNVSREIADYDRNTEKYSIIPVKTMTAKNNEVVLFNTDFYHDVDNTNSKNERTILTLRSSLYENLDFFSARKILFDY